MFRKIFFSIMFALSLTICLIAILENFKQNISSNYNNKIAELKADKKYLKNQLDAFRSNNSYIVEVSAYTARKVETNNNPDMTAIMEKPRSGWSIAVSQDLKNLLGKRVYIEGIGVRYVNDLMNSRYKKRIDILMPTVKMAKKFGIKKNRELILLEPELLFKEYLASRN